jgi:dTDP-4-amino-4,6-dideoxygalactose transaminase
MSDSIPLLDLRAQYNAIQGEIRAAIDRVLSSQRFILGAEGEALEGEIASYCGCDYAVGVSSGTDAILVALMALGVGSGDEVITTPYTFVATATSIARLGARAVFVDIDPATYNIDVGGIEAAIGPRTRCILPVHLFGQLAPMKPIADIASRRGIPVLEDAAQAIGASRDGHGVAAASKGAILSFFPSKNLGGAGDGGMVVTNDQTFAEKVRLLRNQGQAPKYSSVVIGGNFRLDELQAAVLRAKLPHLDAWTAARGRNAARYREAFATLGLSPDTLTLPTELPGRHVYNQFVVRAASRDMLKKHLAEGGIGSEVYYPVPMHLQPCFDGWGGKAGQFPVAESAALSTLALPVYPELRADQIQRVVGSVAAFYKHAE